MRIWARTSADRVVVVWAAGVQTDVGLVVGVIAHFARKISPDRNSRWLLRRRQKRTERVDARLKLAAVGMKTAADDLAANDDDGEHNTSNYATGLATSGHLRSSSKVTSRLGYFLGQLSPRRRPPLPVRASRDSNHAHTNYHSIQTWSRFVPFARLFFHSAVSIDSRHFVTAVVVVVVLDTFENCLLCKNKCLFVLVSENSNGTEQKSRKLLLLLLLLLPRA